MNSTPKFRGFVKTYHAWERTIPFLKIFFTKDGIGSAKGRALIWGKIRRITVSAVPPFARYLRRKYGMQGGCVSCGASCNLLFQCPHWNPKTHLCTVYEDRPNICKLFPITPRDIEDRNLVLKEKACGFKFEKAEL